MASRRNLLKCEFILQRYAVSHNNNDNKYQRVFISNTKAPCYSISVCLYEISLKRFGMRPKVLEPFCLI